MVMNQRYPITISFALSVIMKRPIVILSMVLATLAIAIYIWKDSSSSSKPTWTHEPAGKGMVCSIVSAVTPDGRELVVAGGYFKTDSSGNDLRVIAFEALTGQIVWEQREPRTMDSYLNLEPRLGFDQDGHLLQGCEAAAVGPGLQRSITKRSIVDGSELWSWAAESLGDRPASTGYGHVALPAGASRSHVWISGIRSRESRDYERFIALLDSKTGQQQWFVSCNAAEAFFDRKAVVHPLHTRDAIVVAPPLHHERSFPWIFQRLDESTGAVQWKREMLRDNERNLAEPLHLVDEAHNQLLIFWRTVSGGRWQSEVISLDLTTGVERWRNPSDFSEVLSGGIVGASLDKQTNCVLWGSEESRSTKVNWLKWDRDPELPIPLPESHELRHVRPIGITFSSLDGSTMNKEVLSRNDESPTHLVWDSASPAPRAMFVRTMIKREQLEPWGSIRLDGLSTLPTASGTAAKLDYPRTATVTQSGHIITTGDPTETEVKWIIKAW